MPQPYPQELEEYLAAQGVRFVVVGHTPHGNCPTVIQSQSGRVTVVMGDTSFSQQKSNLSYIGDNRGRAASDISIVHGVCRITGHLQDTDQSKLLGYCVAPGETQNCDRFVGCMQRCSDEADGKRKTFFVKALLPAQPSAPSSYLLSHVDGFKYEYAEVPEREIEDVLSGMREPRPLGSQTHGEDAFFPGGARYTHDQVDQLFEILDRDGDGTIVKGELLAAASCDASVRKVLGAAFPGKNLDEIFEALDVDPDGRVSREEFEQLCSEEAHLHHEIPLPGVALPVARSLPTPRALPRRRISSDGHISEGFTSVGNVRISQPEAHARQFHVPPGSISRSYATPVHAVRRPMGVMVALAEPPMVRRGVSPAVAHEPARIVMRTPIMSGPPSPVAPPSSAAAAYPSGVVSFVRRVPVHPSCWQPPVDMAHGIASFPRRARSNPARIPIVNPVPQGNPRLGPAQRVQNYHYRFIV